MKSITFFDLEIDANSHGIADIGGIKSNGRHFILLLSEIFWIS